VNDIELTETLVPCHEYYWRIGENKLNIWSNKWYKIDGGSKVDMEEMGKIKRLHKVTSCMVVWMNW